MYNTNATYRITCTGELSQGQGEDCLSSNCLCQQNTHPLLFLSWGTGLRRDIKCGLWTSRLGSLSMDPKQKLPIAITHLIRMPPSPSSCQEKSRLNSFLGCWLQELGWLPACQRPGPTSHSCSSKGEKTHSKLQPIQYGLSLGGHSLQDGIFCFSQSRQGKMGGSHITLNTSASVGLTPEMPFKERAAGTVTEGWQLFHFLLALGRKPLERPHGFCPWCSHPVSSSPPSVWTGPVTSS